MKKIVAYRILWIFNMFLRNFHIKKNQIVFISYKSEKVERDFKLVSDLLEKENKYILKYILLKYENSFKGNITYLINCIKQLYYINTSELVVLDYNNFVVSNFKKKEVKVIQLWHSSGAIKKFGNDITRDYEINNYDYVIASSDAWKKPYSSAFGIKEENILITGIPNLDSLYYPKKVKKYKREILKKYPSIKNKKIVLFAPTFRGDAIKNPYIPKMNLESFKRKLGDDFVILYKLHPAIENHELWNEDGIINVREESNNKLFSTADYLISDYSAVIFDYSILNKKMLFYVPDYESYYNDRGFYIDYLNEMPGPICKDEEELYEAIVKDKFDLEKVKKFNSKYLQLRDGKATERVVKEIKRIIA